MEREFVRLVGAGVQVLSEGLGAVAPGSGLRGYALIDHLASDSGEAAALVVGAVQGIWTDWRQTGFPRAVALQHVRGVVTLLGGHRPDPGLLLAAVSGAAAASSAELGTGAGGGRWHPITTWAERLAAQVLERAEASGALERTGLNPRLAFFLAERLFTHLLAEASTLRGLEAPTAAFFARRPARYAIPGEAIARSGPARENADVTAAAA